MRGKGGRPRTFPPDAVEFALVEHDRTGRTWAEIARVLKVNPGTLRARVADFLRERGAHKTPAPLSEEPEPILRSSGPVEVEIVLEPVRSPRLCPLCGMIHSPEVPCL
jgi:hypothetical protein